MSRRAPQIEAKAWIPPVEDPKGPLVQALQDGIHELRAAVADAKAHTSQEATGLALGEVARAFDREMPRRHWRFVVLTVWGTMAMVIVSLAIALWCLHPTCGPSPAGGYVCWIWLHAGAK